MPPNIIFLLTDDQQDNTLGGIGHPTIRTPQLDKLLSKSVRFCNTYIAEPVCCPSRVSFFTGTHERIHGIGFSSSYNLTDEQWVQTYPALLRDNGYFTGFIGKYGVEYHTFKGHEFDKFDYWVGHNGWTRFFPKDYDSQSCKPYHKAKSNIITEIMGEFITQFLDTVPDEKPFCLSVSFNVPHGKEVTTMNTLYDNWHSLSRPANENPALKGTSFYDTLYRGTPFRIPDDCTKDPYQYIPKNILDQDSGRQKTYEYDYKVETCREHHIRYYQLISGMDKVVGDMINTLNEKGLMKNTIIIFSSDNGLLMGDYGMGGKSLLYDLASKVPCFIYDPAIPDSMKGRTLDNLASSLDITKTILDYAGIEAPEFMEGQSLRPLLSDPGVEWRKELFLESLFTLRGNPFCEGVRMDEWKYIRMYNGVEGYKESDIDFSDRQADYEQLFNLNEDPGEHNNLVEKYAGTSLLNELSEKCSNYSVELNKKREEYKKVIGKVVFREN